MPSSARAGADEVKAEILGALKPELGQVTHQLLLVLMIIIIATIHRVLNLNCGKHSMHTRCALCLPASFHSVVPARL